MPRKNAASPRGKSGLLEKTAKAIWGSAFVDPLADCCGVTRKQVRRWLDEVAPVPSYAWININDALLKKRDEVVRLRTQVEKLLPHDVTSPGYFENVDERLA